MSVINGKQNIDTDFLALLGLDELQQYSYSEIYHSLINMATIKKEIDVQYDVATRKEMTYTFNDDLTGYINRILEQYFKYGAKMVFTEMIIKNIVLSLRKSDPYDDFDQCQKIGFPKLNEYEITM